jgi:hypothetical protein
MSYQTFLIICAILIGLPFMVSCFKGNPGTGLIAGFVSFFIMALAARNGASALAVHALGFVIAGFGIAFALRDD